MTRAAGAGVPSRRVRRFVVGPGRGPHFRDHRVALPGDRSRHGFPLEHGSQSTLFAMRLAERLGVDSETAPRPTTGASSTMIGIMRALAGPGNASPVRALRVAGRLPKAVRGHQRHIAALCEVAQMLSDRLGMPASVRALFVHLAERWDGKGEPARLRGEEIPLADHPRRTRRSIPAAARRRGARGERGSCASRRRVRPGDSHPTGG